MKIFKKKLTLYAALLAVLALMLTLSSCSSTGGANDDPRYITWVVSDDKLVLEDSGFTKYRLQSELPAGVEIAPLNTYMFYNSAFYQGVPKEYFGKVCGNRGGSFIWVEADGERYVYANHDGEKLLALFEVGNGISYHLFDTENNWGPISTETVDNMESMRKNDGEKKTVNVTELKNLSRYEIRAYDDTKTLSRDCGAIYRFADGSTYYLNYSVLGNEHFDANGDFSYRSGSVELTRVIGNVETNVNYAVKSLSPYTPSYTWEEQDKDSTSYSALLLQSFWGIFVTAFFVFPALLMALGLILPRVKKLGKPTYWYILSIVAGVWLVLSLILLIILLL